MQRQLMPLTLKLKKPDAPAPVAVVRPDQLQSHNWSFVSDLALTKTLLSFRLDLTGNKFERVNRVRQQLFKLAPLTDNVMSTKRHYKLQIYRAMTNWYLGTLGNCQWRQECNNDTDIDTTQEIKSLSNFLLFCLPDQDKWYGFDIRTLHTIVQLDKQNPYTQRPIREDQLDLIERKMKLCQRFGLTISNRTANLSESERFRLYVVSVFQKLHELDFDVDSQVLLDMDLAQLKKLYVEVADIWGFRLRDLPKAHKERIVQGGMVFSEAPFVQMTLDQPGNREKVLKKIVRNMERMITEGQSREDCKMGATYFMLGLALHSEQVSNAYTWLYDIMQ